MIVRTYFCDNCEREFDVVMESGNDPDPKCTNPDCDKVLEWIPARFAVKTNKSRAMDVTQKIMEQDYQMSNWKDNNREGDIAAMGVPAETTSAKEERVKMEREIAEMAASARPQVPESAVSAFWGGAHGGAPANNITAQSLLASAKVGMADPNHVNPMKFLQDGIKSGAIPQPQQMQRIVSRWKPGQT